MMRRRGGGRRGPGLVGTVARTAVVAGTATVVAKGVSGAMDNRSADQQQAEADEQAADQADAQQQDDVQALQQQVADLQAQQTQAAVEPEPEPAAGGSDDMIAQLTQLGDLKTAGLLTDAEFEAAKARVLGG